VNRKLALTLTLIVLMAGMFFTEQVARADILNFNLSSTTFAGMPGQTVDFLGTISAPGTNAGEIDLVGLNIAFGDNLGGPWLAFNHIDPTPFFNLPEFLGPGDSLTNVPLFRATIDPTAVPVSGVVRVNLVAFDAAGIDVSTTAVAGAQIVPEPANLSMLGIVAIGLAGIICRKF
jgi:hypothetical protein